MSDTLTEIFILLGLILFNGIFSMTEIALVSARKVRLMQRAEDGDKSARVALDLSNNPNRLLSTTQIGITLVGILTGAIGSATLGDKLAALLATIPGLAPYSLGISVAVIVLLTTYFSLVIGELIPKRLAMNNPEAIAIRMAPFMKFLSVVTAPIIHLLSASTEIGLKILRSSSSKEPPITQEEIKILMEQGTQVGVFEESEQDMVDSIFRLANRYVDALMTPRTEIEWIDLDEPLDDIIQQIQASQHTRFPVASENLDNVQGMLLAKDLLAARLASSDLQLQDFIKPPVFVPESTNALKVLERIKESGLEVALVIDEFGGLLGMVTLYDLLEAIIGNLPTAGNESELDIVEREDGSYLLDGLLPVDELKDLLDLDTLPEEDRVGFQTAGGFIMSQLGSIPSVGQHFEYANYHFEVIDMDGRRIDKILVSRLPNNPPDTETPKI